MRLLIIFLIIPFFCNGQYFYPLLGKSATGGVPPVIKNQISAYSTTALTCTSNTVDMTGVTSIVIAVTFNVFGSGWTNTISDSKGNVYTLAANDADGFGFIYYCTGLTSSNVSSTMTFTCKTATNYELEGVFFTVYGLTGISALDTHNSAIFAGITATISTPSITPAYSGEFIVVAAGNIFYGATTALSNGFTLDQSIDSHETWNCQGHLLTTSTSAISTTLSNGGSGYNYWGLCIASFH